MKARLLKKTELKSCKENAKNIVSLGTAGFIMQLTNSSGNYLLQQCSGGYRRGCLHICYDYRIQCPSDGRDADLCYK